MKILTFLEGVTKMFMLFLSGDSQRNLLILISQHFFSPEYFIIVMFDIYITLILTAQLIYLVFILFLLE